MERIFRKPNGTLQGILQSQDNLIQDDWVELTDVEVDALKNPPKTIKQKISEKESYLNNTDWINDKYNDLVVILKTISEVDFIAKYQDIYNARALAREEINTLEAELAALEA